MTTLPTVSVIIPCHNRFDFLHECLESVAKQSYQSIELIVVDDASEQNEVEKIIERVEWSSNITVIYIRSNVRIGPGQAREMGRLRTSGNYIAYLDSDDLWHPDKLSKQVKNLLSNPSAGMSYCAASQFVELPILGTEPFFGRSDGSFDRIFPHLHMGRPWATAACLWTRDAVQKIGPWCKSWIGEDFAYDWTAGCLDMQITYVSEILCYVRRGSKSKHLTGMTEAEFANYCLPAYMHMIETLQRTGKIKVEELREWIKGKMFLEGFRLVKEGESLNCERYFQVALKILKEFPSSDRED